MKKFLRIIKYFYSTLINKSSIIKNYFIFTIGSSFMHKIPKYKNFLKQNLIIIKYYLISVLKICLFMNISSFIKFGLLFELFPELLELLID